jgi:hypothetical protein
VSVAGEVGLASDAGARVGGRHTGDPGGQPQGGLPGLQLDQRRERVDRLGGVEADGFPTVTGDPTVAHAWPCWSRLKP